MLITSYPQSFFLLFSSTFLPVLVLININYNHFRVRSSVSLRLRQNLTPISLLTAFSRLIPPDRNHGLVRDSLLYHSHILGLRMACYAAGNAFMVDSRKRIAIYCAYETWANYRVSVTCIPSAANH